MCVPIASNKSFMLKNQKQNYLPSEGKIARNISETFTLFSKIWVNFKLERHKKCHVNV
jgi:hypothetical protein